MNKILSFMTGMLFGSLAGVALALLLTPKTGESIRTDIKREVDAVMEEGRRAADVRRKELESQLAQMRGEATPSAAASE